MKAVSRSIQSHCVAACAAMLVVAGVHAAEATGNSTTQGKAVPAATLDSVARGKALFDVRCGICHAKGGMGTVWLGRRLGPDNASLADRVVPAELVEHVVRNGINSMPVFTRVELTDAELQLIAVYLSRPREAR